MQKQEIDSQDNGNFNLLDTINLILVNWKIELRIISIATILAIIISLILPKYYRSTTVILPQTNEGGLAGLASLSGLASVAGFNFGETTLEQLYPDIIRSEIVLKEVIYSKYLTKEYSIPTNLIEYWQISKDDSLENYELALKQLRELLEVKLDFKTNIVTISLITKEPQLSADIINKVVMELDKFMRTKKRTNASEQRKWIEGRLQEVKIDLEKSENNLKRFREDNRRTIESPALMLEQARFSRDVDINIVLFTELKKQYELSKIEEVKNIPVISVMDPARPAGRKDKPARAVIVITIFMLSVFSAIGYVYVSVRYHTEIEHILVSLKIYWRNIKD
jgi:uncharacterized protein involved in exopolysaccharide biosynthesis